VEFEGAWPADPSTSRRPLPTGAIDRVP